MTVALSSESTETLPDRLCTETLHQLAKAYGIYTEYADAFGTQAVPPNETLVKILQVFGVDTANTPALQASLQAKTLQGYQTVVPPSYVVSVTDELTGEQIGVPIHLPVAQASHVFRWQVQLEGGHTTLEGDYQFTDAEVTYTDEATGVTYGKYWLHLSEKLPFGYHTLVLHGSQQGDRWQGAFIYTPNQCYLPKAMAPRWGVAVQLYAQQSASNMGVGNLTDLAAICQWAGGQGASMVGVNPLHSLFPSRPGHHSPYSPASRLFGNVLYIDPQSTPEWVRSREADKAMAQYAEIIAKCRRADAVDYVTLTPVLMAIFNGLFSTFVAKELNRETPRAAEFEAFCEEQGEALLRYATFMAISEAQDRDAGHTVCWWDWPTSLQQAENPAVETFAREHYDRVTFYQYLQFVLHQQLATVQAATDKAGMAIGLYGDLAVGSDVSGADVWQNPSLYARNVRVGCPPDDCNRLGQDWGLPPIKPDVLQQQGYQPWAALLAANMQHMGAIRIDHAMAMLRLFWIPEGMNGTQGTYVSYPYYDMLGVLALESHRNQCVVIGEDLGTVPPEIFESFPRWNVHSYRLLYFQRQQNGQFIPPNQYPPMAMATLSTHDLATLPGFWESSDIAVRDSLGLYPTPEVHASIANARPEEKQALVTALHQQGLWPTATVPDAWTIELTEAAYRYLASTPCHLVMCQMEDLVGQVPQVNLPGTVNEHPNWQRKITVPIEGWLTHASIQQVCQAMGSVRQQAHVPL